MDSYEKLANAIVLQAVKSMLAVESEHVLAH